MMSFSRAVIPDGIPAASYTVVCMTLARSSPPSNKLGLVTCVSPVKDLTTGIKIETSDPCSLRKQDHLPIAKINV